MAHRVTLVAGDGIGPEVADAARAVVDATGAAIEWIEREAGAGAIARAGDPLPEDVLESIRETRVALKGPITTPVGTGFTSVNVRLRRALDLYASVRPVQTMPGVTSKYSGVDLVIIRENTEGLYSGLEHEVVPGVVETLKVFTEKGCTRIAEYAFMLARRDKRRKVSAAHKTSIMRMTDGLFLDCCRNVAARYPDVSYEEVVIDNLCMQLALDPAPFDVILLENLYGDIVSDLASGLVGGLGLVPGANIGTAAAVFEAVHGSAPDIAGKDVANPIALILSAALMLRHLGEGDAADRVVRAVVGVLSDGKVRTRDLGGSAGTRSIRDAIVARVRGGRS
jgi:isocitrate dehydrogenase (NAD+)